MINALFDAIPSIFLLLRLSWEVLVGQFDIFKHL